MSKSMRSFQLEQQPAGKVALGQVRKASLGGQGGTDLLLGLVSPPQGTGGGRARHTLPNSEWIASPFRDCCFLPT
jgi:hypothetical protein